MHIDRWLENDLSRRTFFRYSGVSVAGGSAVFLAACGGDGDGDSGGEKKATGAENDIKILNSAVDLENAAVAAYTAGAALLKGGVLKVGKQFRDQEQEHVDGLGQAIRDLGGTPNEARSSYPFPALKTQNDVLRFANDLEQTAVLAYVDAIPKLSSGDLRATAAQIVTNEAEHISVLLGALGRPPVPDAFVKGARKVTL